MPDRYVSVSGNKKVLKPFIESPTGGSDGGKPVALNPDTGKIHAGFLPDTSMPLQSVISSEVVGDRLFVNFHNVSGNQRCRTSLGTYDRRASGFVAVGGQSGETLSVQTAGEITIDIGSTGVVAGDINAPMFADPVNAGRCTKTAPSTAGQARQYLGHIVSINAGTGTFALQLTIGEAEELV